MSKGRRTKKQKVQAKHNFEISWQPKPEKLQAPAVKGQTENNFYAQNLKTKNANKTGYTGYLLNIGTIKKDLAKSLMLSVLILGIETVLYLLW